MIAELRGLRGQRNAHALGVGLVLFFAASLAAQESVDVPKRIVVATRKAAPFSMRNEQGEWVGISIELLREIKVELQTEVEHDIELVFREMELEPMLDAVAAGNVDLAAAAITVNYEREKRMNFTHPYYSAGLAIAVAADERAGWAGILKGLVSTTFLRILAGLFAAMLISAVAVYYVERRENRDDFGGGAIRGIASGLWWSAVTLTTVGYGDKVPKTIVGRLIGLLWMFTGLFIIATFTAAVSSALTVNQLQSRISGPADLARARVATSKDSTSAKYLSKRYIKFMEYDNISLALAALNEGRHDAVVYDQPILLHEIYETFPGQLLVLPTIFQREDYAFALPDDSPLRERINRVLLRRIESPEWKDVLSGYLGEGMEP